MKISTTKFLIILIVISYIIQQYLILDFGKESIYKDFALWTPAIKNGEVWRCISCLFMHENLIHLFFNISALNILGEEVEKINGKVYLICVYFFSAITSGIASSILTNGLSIGASGAIFGLLGSLLALSLNLRNYSYDIKEKVNSLITVIAINIIISYLLPNIDIYAHIGGLIGGFIFQICLIPKIIYTNNSYILRKNNSIKTLIITIISLASLSIFNKYFFN